MAALGRRRRRFIAPLIAIHDRFDTRHRKRPRHTSGIHSDGRHVKYFTPLQRHNAICQRIGIQICRVTQHKSDNIRFRHFENSFIEQAYCPFRSSFIGNQIE